MLYLNFNIKKKTFFIVINKITQILVVLYSNKERGASIRIGETDDGDYATLKELPLGSSLMLDPGDDTSEEGKVIFTYKCLPAILTNQ